jgi:hypothetical protein
MKKITKKRLKAWAACKDGYIRFNQLFPKGADLQTASAGLIADGHPEWSDWLWDKCKYGGDAEFVSQTIVTVGDHGTATAGKYGKAIAGKYGTAKAGEGGIIVICFFNNKTGKPELKTANIGGKKGLKPNTPYMLDAKGNFVEVI